MTGTRLVDAVVAGAGMAGASAAAALGALGFEVLVVEPGLDGTRRLAGELIHPPGLTDLAQLGLLDSVEPGASVAVQGFAVFPDAASSPYLLPYGEIPGVDGQGRAIDHATLTTGLRRAVERLPHVTLWDQSRVTGVDLGHADFAAVTVWRDGRELPLRARLVVAADGATSRLRRMAGIGHQRSRISRMAGFLLGGVSLPEPGFGNIFLGGPAPALAYGVGREAVRVMFDIPGNPHGVDAPRREPAYCAALPKPFRQAVQSAMRVQTGLVSTNHSVIADAVFRHRLVLVGDAAGCCHPLTATGLSVCTRDALTLREAIREADGDVPAALRRYAKRRGGRERTRVALAEALYQAFLGRTPDMRLLREGLLGFWKHSRRGRAASMALLSTHEGRMSVMAVQYARAAAHALIGLTRLRRGRRTEVEWRLAVTGLTRATLRCAWGALRRP